MFFLIRMAFWLSVVFALLPDVNPRPTTQAPSARPELSATQAVSAATATVSDVSQFCRRQPAACAFGAQAVSAFSARAQAGAKMVFDFLSEQMIAHDAGAPATAGAGGHAAAKASQNTLTPSDLAPAWRGPHRNREVAGKTSA